MSYVRCRWCRARRTLARHPDEYTRVPKCRRCRGAERHNDGQQLYYVDRYRARAERGKGAKAALCYPGRGGCNGYHFPHRRGSRFCDHNPKLTEDDLRERHERGCP